MSPERAKFLRENIHAKLTAEELAEGWFFCCTWDFMLINKDDREAECCGCRKGAE
jgi:hypothetical protein